MNFVVLNGSPKGKLSVTMQYVAFIQKKFPAHELEILHISQRIKKIEKDPETLQAMIDKIQAADGVLWATPVYYMLVPAQYKRFIELVWKHTVFRDKYAAVLTTSIHFFDHTAHNYLRAVCEDLGMIHVGGFSADMNDLRKPEERERLVDFAAHCFQSIEANAPAANRFAPLPPASSFVYTPGPSPQPVDAGGKVIRVITDAEAGQANLIRMVERFAAAAGGEVLNLHDIDIAAGCQGCLQCGYDGRCAFEGKDEFVDFYNTKIKTADVLVFAGAVKDRYLSSRWKRIFDRSFFNNHTPMLIGKQLGFIVAGPLSRLANLRQVLAAYTELQRANLVGFATDEVGDSARIDAQLDRMAANASRFAARGYVAPQTFLGIGGMKIFRDDVWGRLRIVFRADYQAYKALGIFDSFPQRSWRLRLLNWALPPLLRIPRFRQEFIKRIKPGMVAPLQRVVERE